MFSWRNKKNIVNTSYVELCTHEPLYNMVHFGMVSNIIHVTG